ncbi:MULTISPECIES: hypothetical protein [unclassified Ruegeria]|uniref:hypothetical protein n=1 Tax=unclassified Ruegeria TaxID=2625375 RepID=UPI001487B377|nr:MULTISPECIES: hypothetical protein [unclassified Ruegeria]NOD35877.1 hypothetical protein [Ruegeria sp. HKCCD7296]NOE40076.1 hypothetical protein [Ruegeria sp. HKCCD7319]
MTSYSKQLLGAAALVALSGCADTSSPATGQPSVGSSSDLTAFEGARAGQAEMGIQNLGYELIRTDGLTAFWFNRSTGACARITTSDGRYSDVTMLPAGDC